MLDCLYVRFIYVRGGFSQFILIEKVRGTESKGPDNGCGADVFSIYWRIEVGSACLEEVL